MRAIRLFAAFLLAVAAPLLAGEPLTAPVLAARLREPSPPLVLDVRSADEYAAGHIPGARLIPHDEIAAHAQTLDPARELVLYCRSGRRARIAGDWLQAQGYTVRYLRGDFPGWAAAGLPVEPALAPDKDEP